MKVINGKFGQCKIVSCMDQDQGIPSLEEKSFDIGFSDPPWGVDYKVEKKHNPNGGNYEDKILRTDWIADFFRISKRQIIDSGEQKFYWFMEHFPPQAVVMLYVGWTTTGSSVSKINQFSPFLLYNIQKQPYGSNVIKVSRLCENRKFKHASPKLYEAYSKILKPLQPLSIVDLFVGSGTTCSFAEEHGINWLGFESNEEYIPDIERRINEGIKAHKRNEKGLLGM